MERTVEWVGLASASDRHTGKTSESRDRIATPSFALMDVQGPVIVTYVYQLGEGEVSWSLLNRMA